MTDAPRPIDLSLADLSTPIAEDFYRHVNGGWLDANPVPPQYGSWGAFHEVNERNQELLRTLLEAAAAEPGTEGSPERMAGDYFASGMDEAAVAAAGVEPLRPLLDLVDAAGDASGVRAAALALQPFGVGVLHSLYVAPDFENAAAYLPYFGQGGLGLPERDYYLRDDERSTELRVAYADHIATQLANLGEDPGAAREAAAAILTFETELAAASHPAEKMRDVDLTLNRHDIAALDALAPGLGLGDYARSLGVTTNSVNVDNPGFFEELERLLVETPMETVRAYLRFHVVASFASALPAPFENASFEFYGRLLGGQREMKPRWKRVLDAASADIGEQVSRLYVAEAFPPSAKDRCEELVDGLFAAMGRAIERAEWMGAETRAEALAKLAGFTYKIGYPDTWRDYSALVIDRGPWVSNRMRAARFEHDRQFARLLDPVDTTEWEMAPHIVNAYYHPLLNEIVFPAGILQPPFFYAEADDAVNYGAIGAVIGHEITHGFDDRGSRFDAKGALRDWWTETDRREFEKRSDVLVGQFDAFTVLDGLPVNGRLTLGENIADLGGVSVALDALRAALPDNAPLIDGMTPEQRFFWSYAAVWRMNYTDEHLRLLVNVDPHSPTFLRVRGPLANFAAFAEAFEVSEGSPMALPVEQRAHIW